MQWWEDKRTNGTIKPKYRLEMLQELINHVQALEKNLKGEESTCGCRLKYAKTGEYSPYINSWILKYANELFLSLKADSEKVTKAQQSERMARMFNSPKD